MTSLEFRNRLAALASQVPIDVPPAVFEPLATYFEVLSHWNSKINLTSLPLQPPSDETFCRLLLEPLEAAQHVPAGGQHWFDIGSGGGSPAIPMKLARPDVALTMVESKARKAAFLRELIRVLGLSCAEVKCSRLQDLAIHSEAQNLATLVTIRGVKLNNKVIRATERLITNRGELWVFCSVVPELSPVFSYLGSIPLRSVRCSRLARYARSVFHVEQTS